MKTKISLLLVLFALITANGFSQEKTKKQLKEEKKLEKQKQTDDLISSKEFVFIARYANPMGMRSVNLTSNPNFVKFHPDLIDSYMPYFGRAYNAVGYGTDTGLKFKGKPEKFTVGKTKKNYEIDIEVKGESDSYKLYLQVGFEGSASLSITGNNRSSISYTGEISAPEKKEEKK
jgi:hypothetical protein